MSSAIYFNLDQPKILSFGNWLIAVRECQQGIMLMQLVTPTKLQLELCCNTGILYITHDAL